MGRVNLVGRKKWEDENERKWENEIVNRKMQNGKKGDKNREIKTGRQE